MKGLASANMASPKRITLSVKISEDTAVLLRQFVRDYAGKPYYYTIGTFVEQAILKHISASEDPPESALSSRRTALTTDLINNHRKPCR